MELSSTADIDFWRNKRVLITGHTGFKGSWLSYILKMAGADICGYSLEPPTEPSLFNIANISNGICSCIGDIRDFDNLLNCIDSFEPEIVFHLAAQPIVLDGYKDPRYTYETNVMGTVNLLEAIRKVPSVRSVINVTTDKVYLNIDRSNYAFKESDPLDGRDPYSNSKSCSELVTHSYSQSFFNDAGCAVSTVRAGNVIGGGDFSPDRIIPDCIRAIQNHTSLIIRNPASTRPYQHVLEPLFAYLMIARCQYQDIGIQGAYNVGPNEADCINTDELVKLFGCIWGGEEFQWEYAPDVNSPYESSFLKLDSSKLKRTFAWSPVWSIEKAIQITVEWYKSWLGKENIESLMNKQILWYTEE